MPDRDDPLSTQSQPQELARFYDRSYSRDGADAQLYSRWRAIGARGKADHVIALCERAQLRPAQTLEVGCGDGSLLSELHRRDFGGRLAGVEISASGVALARQRPEISEVVGYDGERLPFSPREFDLTILSHVLEHVTRPHELLAEAARVSRAVVFEVPLEANLSAARRAKRSHALEVGHLHRLDRTAARAIAHDAGLRIAGELDDSLSREALSFFARGSQASAAASAKWAVRAGVHRLAPSLARRTFTVHYACLCLPDQRP
jgi:SAM-dependent methyltransferase